MTTGCIIDAELFKKYCLDNNCNSIFEAAKCLIEKGENHSVVQECNCLLDLLEAISYQKYILYYSDKIKEEYKNQIDNLPEDILDCLEKIFSNANSSRKIIKGGFKLEDFNKIRSTKLEHKKIYLDSAKSIPNERTIVSSYEDITINYKPHRIILMEHDIYSKNVCKQWTEIKKCLMKQT